MIQSRVNAVFITWKTLLPQIRVSQQCLVQQFDEVAALLDGDLLQSYALLKIVPHPFQNLRTLVLDVLQGLPGGVAVDDRIDHIAGLLVEGDMHGIGIAEQVVQISQDLLVGADQKETDVVVLVLADLVQRLEWLRGTLLEWLRGGVAERDAACYLAIDKIRKISSGVSSKLLKTPGKSGTLPIFSKPLKKKRGAAEKAVPHFTTLSLPLNSKRYILKAEF